MLCSKGAEHAQDLKTQRRWYVAVTAVTKELDCVQAISLFALARQACLSRPLAKHCAIHLLKLTTAAHNRKGQCSAAATLDVAHHTTPGRSTQEGDSNIQPPFKLTEQLSTLQCAPDPRIKRLAHIGCLQEAIQPCAGHKQRPSPWQLLIRCACCRVQTGNATLQVAHQ